MPSLIVAGAASDSLAIASGNDGALTLQTGPSGAKVNALSFTSDGTPTFLKARGGVAQIQTFQTGALATGTTAIPQDDTIPQITEGDQYMSQAITPINAGSMLEITVTLVGTAGAGNSATVALFQDATANALKAVSVGIAANVTPAIVVFTHYMTAGTTSPTTFRVRAGCVGPNTFTFNGASSARLMGGVMASSITIKEYLP